MLPVHLSPLITHATHACLSCTWIYMSLHQPTCTRRYRFCALSPCLVSQPLLSCYLVVPTHPPPLPRALRFPLPTVPHMSILGLPSHAPHTADDMIETVPCPRSSASRARHTVQFRCRVCFRTFPRRNAIEAHVRSHDPKLKLSCKLCEITFTSDCTLRRHEHRKHGLYPSCTPNIPDTPATPTVSSQHTATPPNVDIVMTAAMVPAPAAPTCTPPLVSLRAPHSATCAPAAVPAAFAPAPAPDLPILAPHDHLPPSPPSLPLPPPAAPPAPAPCFVPFDVTGVIQVYPRPGSDLTRCNSIVYTAFLVRSDVFPYLNGCPIVYKTTNPLQPSM
jgi:hypothetical protein